MHLPTTVIVIDDDALVRDAFSLLLNECGYICYTAPDGGQGERLLEVISADIVITDIDMPHQDGFETISHINKRWPDKKIIAISGSSDSREYADMAASLGVSTYLTKPVTVTQMIRAINSCLPMQSSEVCAFCR